MHRDAALRAQHHLPLANVPSQAGAGVEGVVVVGGGWGATRRLVHPLPFQGLSGLMEPPEAETQLEAEVR